MKITGFETIPIQGRAMILKMFTDEGLVGYGEPMNYEHWRVVAQAVDDMAEYLVGKDPLQIEDHWQSMYRSSYSRSMPVLIGALSGIEMAMWDVFGKAVELPVWRLLGGSVRKRIRVYTGTGGTTPQQCAESAIKAVESGFNAVKMGASPRPVRFVDTPKVIDTMVSRVAAVREAVGDEVDIAIDLHRRLSPTMAAIVVKELEPLRPLFAEEPCHPENSEPLLMLSRSTTVPIATGERHLTRWGFREIIEREMCAILQPDIRHCGGMMELKKIAAMAEIHNMAIAPHNAAGPIGVAASLHVIATIPNLLICEGGHRRGEGLFETPLVFKDGFVELPTAPGLGVDMADEAIEKVRDETFRLRGMFRHQDDGSFADY
ncbi:MAG: galactonate dehydratase [Candidatus Poribacteria bacterium]|jgi:galactonate dehydratase|nr:galactonate dehydratase [Candidatus Poribacteria bacterium]MDP6745586.1 galactonate dehydratase [Candidatus Poribacteria bacterium]MDP6997596.1 galactonate dehydratase [Candidatus Poribacteria bacterium]